MDCLFCKIIAGEIPSNKIYEDDKIFAFTDINAQAPTHFLVVPKLHIQSMAHTSVENIELLGYIQLKIAEIAKEIGISETGYRVVSNVGDDGGQTVNHLHYHILGGRFMKWPPG